MRFFRYLDHGRPRFGVAVDGRGYPLVGGGGRPVSQGRLLRMGAAALRRLTAAAAAGPSLGAIDERTGTVGPDGSGVTRRLLAPVVPPRNLIMVGKNYPAHVNEVRGTAIGAARPEAPVVFTKAPTAVTGPGAPIPSHRGLTAELDYEGEFAVVIGRGGRAIPREAAWDHVFGLTLIDDVTARDLQRRHRQFFIGKSLDGTAPMGPFLVHRSVLPSPDALVLTTRVGGELRQRGRLSEAIFPVAELIAVLSAGMTLLPGDVIATGTPSGVGAGFDPPRFLRPGDVVEIACPAIGTLVNPVA